MKPETIIVFISAAIVPYMVCGLNPAIVMSKLIYHRDIRELGSKNPGFTNFKRVFGGKYAWFVFLLDILKSFIVCLAAGFAFGAVGENFQLGAAYAGLFAMLGHCFPIWYKFNGGKAFLVAVGSIWLIDWRTALIAMTIMMILLFTVKFMSLSVIIAGISCPITLAIFGTPLPVLILCILSVTLMTWRHKENIKRLIKGTEPKFSLKSKKA